MHDISPNESQLSKALREALGRDDWLDARRHAEALVRLRPDLARFQYNLGVILLRTRDWKQAHRAFASALKIDPEHEKARLGLLTTQMASKSAENVSSANRMVRRTSVAPLSPSAPVASPAVLSPSANSPLAVPVEMHAAAGATVGPTSSGPTLIPKMPNEAPAHSGQIGKPKERAGWVRRLARYGALVGIMVAVFVAGVRFEKWGGLDRMMPVVIDFAREKVVGDEMTLELERRFLELQDALQLWRSPPPVHHDTTERDIVSKETESISYGLEESSSISALSDVLEIASSTAFADSPPGDSSEMGPPNAFDSASSAVIASAEEGSSSASVAVATDTTDTLEFSTMAGPDKTTMQSPPAQRVDIWESGEFPPKSGRSLYSKAVLRPDPKRDYAVVHAYRFDMTALRLEFVPGLDKSKGLPGQMDAQQKQRVAWMFNGGFQYRHGNFGAKLNGKVIFPPRPGIATLLFGPNDTYDIVAWPNSGSNQPQAATYRQNEIPLIMDGLLSPEIDKMWGYTPKDKDPIYTERSALGFTDRGELVFAVGASVSASTLGKALLQAEVVKAMHLDMNYYNVHLVQAKRNALGELATVNENRALSYYPRLYLDPTDRDFFILTIKKE